VSVFGHFLDPFYSYFSVSPYLSVSSPVPAFSMQERHIDWKGEDKCTDT
jgi:hypothetical protein